jgi:SAM-dependent methyltransferase
MLELLQPRQYYLERLGTGDILEDFRREPNGSVLFERYRLREHYVREFGFVILTQETHEVLVQLLESYKVLDAGSGTGYIAKALENAGINITAADSDTGSYGFAARHKRDIDADTSTLLPGDYDAVLLAWPCYATSFGHQVISAMKPGQLLVFQGEGQGGCTADDAFFDELDNRWTWLEGPSKGLNKGHAQFPGIHDRWSVYQRTS